jgi:5-formyltetrahydrofolate cyclo-ligase
VDIEFDKASQRLKYRQHRDEFVGGLSEGIRNLAFSRIPSPLRALLRPGLTVAGYIPIGSEADPSAILAEARTIGCQIALPRVAGRSTPMRFLRWDPGDPLISGPLGLLQPAEHAEKCDPDIALVPLVAFDSQLNRLGQGAGHYDRALSILENTTAIGFAWSAQMAPSIITDPWDIPLDAVLTEQSWISL